MNNNNDIITLGNTAINIPHMGFGTSAWGDRLFWGFGRDFEKIDLQSAFETNINSGLNFIDTAELYGRGRSERFIGEFLKLIDKQDIIVATKFFPFPWRLRKISLHHALRESLKRLQINQVDLYQIHFAFPPVPLETWADGLADAVEDNLVRAVGVSNFNVKQMRRTHAALTKRGVLLASNQVEYNLLNRKVEKSGLLDLCKQMGVTLIAYSPLAQGVLTGKYSTNNSLPGLRGRRYSRKFLERIQPLLHQLQNIGKVHEGKTIAQVAINWLICKGVIPIPGSKNQQQASQNAGALGWRLTDEEVATLDDISYRVV